jgi:hypothetical protein
MGSGLTTVKVSYSSEDYLVKVNKNSKMCEILE